MRYLRRIINVTRVDIKAQIGATQVLRQETSKMVDYVARLPPDSTAYKTFTSRIIVIGNRGT